MLIHSIDLPVSCLLGVLQVALALQERVLALPRHAGFTSRHGADRRHHHRRRRRRRRVRSWHVLR
jgi:hypothetical protein